MRESNSSGKKPIEEVEAQRLRKAKFERVSSVSKCKKPELPLATVGITEEKARRKTGIDILGEVQWGTHFCVFYQSKQDLIDILVPYFKEGLENNEFCMWITSEPLNSEDAGKSLSQAVTNLDDYIKKGQIEILDYSDWYTKTGAFEADSVLKGWVQKHDQAIKNGFDGLRVTGNTLWLEKKDWIKFTDYEAVVNSVIGKYRMLAICTYCLDKCGASEILDVENNHQFSLIKWRGDWKILESSSKNQLEARLAEQTAIAQALKRSKKDWVKTFNAMSDWVALIDVGGRILRTNRAGENFTGKTLDEIIGQSCCKLVHDSDKHLPGCPLRTMLHTRQRSATELNVPNTNRWLMVTVDPVIDGKGNLIGAVHITRDITQRKKDEKALRESEQRYKYIYEQSPVGIVLSTPDGRVVCANKTMGVITGYFEEELKKINLADTYENPQDRKKLLETIDRYGCAVDFPTRFKRKDGTVYDALLNVSRVHLAGKDLFQTICMDITERKKAEERISFLAEIVKSSPLSVITTDKNARIAYVNPTTEKLFGYKAEELIGKDPGILNAEPDPVKSQKEMSDSIAQRNYWKGEVLNRKKNGEVFHLGASVFQLHDEKGNFVAMVGFQEDITERKQAEEALRESEERFRAIFEQAADSIVLVDGETGALLEFNERTHEILGYTREDFKKLKIPDFEVVESTEEVDKHINKIIREGSDIFETKHRTKDGEIRDVVVSSKALSIGGKKFCQSIWHDITDRKKAEVVLRESEEKFKNIFENANDGVIYLDNSGKILDVNEKAVQMFGGSKPEALNKHFTEVGVFPADEIPSLISNFEGILAGKETILTVPIKNKKGQELILECSASLTSTDGEAGNIMVIARDITERKKAEEQIAKLARFPAENPNPVLRVSGYGTVIYGNKASGPLLKVWQCRVGKSLPDEWYEVVLDALSSGQSQQTEVKCDGRIFSLTFAPVTASNYVNVYGLDITERKQAEGTLRIHGEIMTNMSEGVYLIRASDGVIVYTNPKFEEMFGYRPGELIGKHVSVINAPTEKTPKETAEEIMKVLNEKGSWRGEICNIKKDGTPFWCYAGVSIFDHPEHGRVWVSMHTDITERKQAEKKVLEDQEQLRSLASELSLVEERERRRIAEGLHDDISQPLAFLNIKLDLLKKSTNERSFVDSFSEMEATIGKLISSARTFTFDLSSPVVYELGLEAGIEDWLHTNIQAKRGIATTFEDDGQIKPLGDDMRGFLFQAVKELLVNVVKHAKASSVKVSVVRDEDKIKIRVEDNGVGFNPAEKKGRLFDPSGYGLFSIRERLDYLRGSFDIESKLGHGTRVTLVAPLKLES